MIKLLVLVVTLTCTLVSTQGVSTECRFDNQCTTGYFCQSDIRFCRECLSCEDLHRQPPRGHISCVRSVSECGLCLEGYDVDRQDMGSGCTEPKGKDGIAWYLWMLGALVIVCLLVCAIGVVIYALRNTDSFRVLTWTGTSVEAPVVGKVLTPTAPQPPPYNYNAPYEPVRPSSPDSNPSATLYSDGDGDYSYKPTSNSDPAAPLVKRLPSSRGGAARESAGSQSARVFTNPAYVRNVPPPSYDSALSDDEQSARFEPVDEDTMPSPWTPAADTQPQHSDNGESLGASGGEVEAAGGAAPALRRPARAAAASPPPAKIRAVEDSNNNRNGGSFGGPPSPPAAPAPPAAPSVVINVLNVNAVHQRNDVTL